MFHSALSLLKYFICVKGENPASNKEVVKKRKYNITQNIRTIVFIFFAMLTTFRPTRPLVFFFCVYVELGSPYRTSNEFLYSIHRVDGSNFVNHDRVQMLSQSKYDATDIGVWLKSVSNRNH